MTHEQRNKRILAVIQEGTARALKSKESARDMLIAEGIYTPDGELSPEYGGAPTKKQPLVA